MTDDDLEEAAGTLLADLFQAKDDEHAVEMARRALREAHERGVKDCELTHNVCWHCGVSLEPETRPHCERCMPFGMCDADGCEEPGCKEDK